MSGIGSGGIGGTTSGTYSDRRDLVELDLALRGDDTVDSSPLAVLSSWPSSVYSSSYALVSWCLCRLGFSREKNPRSTCALSIPSLNPICHPSS